MASVPQLISTSIVRAETSKKKLIRLRLSSNDLLFLLVGTAQKGLLFPKPKDSDSNNFIQHLKTSLSRTLDLFPPLAGRLGKLQLGDNTTHFFIDCNDAGVQFVHAMAENITISDILEPINYPNSILHSVFPMNDIKNYEGVSKPLLAVQVTELADGIFIGFTLNHSVADGATLCHFINSWCEISRGSYHISKLPVFENWFRSESYCPAINFPSSVMDENFTPPPPLLERVFHFNKENIARLKSRANFEAGTEKISSLQSLLAHVWRSIIRSQKLDPEEEAHFHLPIGLRSRMEPPIPELYFGNAVQGGLVTRQIKELLEEGLGHTALPICDMVIGCTSDKLMNKIEAWINNPELADLNFKARNMVCVAGSHRFNIYDHDFGWGRPLAARTGPAAKRDGLITLYQGFEDGSIDVGVCTLPEVLLAIVNDSEFMDSVTV